MFYRSIWLGIAAATGLATAQAPEFAQQYKQRIGGALDELRTIIADFDKDAEASGLTRDEGLATYRKSSDSFLQARGQSMTGAMDRLALLETQQQAFATTAPLTQPLLLLKSADRKLLQGVWEDFDPGLPAGQAGFGWLAAGFLAGGGMTSLSRRVLRGRKGDDNQTGASAASTSDQPRDVAVLAQQPVSGQQPGDLARAINQVRARQLTVDPPGRSEIAAHQPHRKPRH
jgi:hypothetical protein